MFQGVCVKEKRRERQETSGGVKPTTFAEVLFFFVHFT